MLNKAVVYARYSSDLQKKTSIDDQVRNCRKYAHTLRIEITEIYQDEALSGTSINRPAYQKMLSDAESGLFSVLVLDDLSRLGRDVANNLSALNQLKYCGVRVISVEERFDSINNHAMSDFMPVMKGMFDQMYIKDLAHKTHRGLEGQFERGYSTGGSVYGYRTVPVYDESNPSKKSALGYKFEIVESEAEVVRIIFEMYADGNTPRSIVAHLNQEGILSPSGKEWANSVLNPHIKRQTGLLLQSMYNGQRIWNKTHSLKHPITGTRKQVKNPVSEWKFAEDESLRIIPVELWNRVQNRIRKVNTKSQAQTEGIAQSSGRRPGGTLFSGLLKCPCCGGNLIASGRNHFGCSRAINKGTCGNRTYLKRTEIEEQLLSYILQVLNTPENIETYKAEINRLLDATETENLPADAIRADLTKVENKIANLIEAVEEGMKFEMVKGQLGSLEAKKIELEAEMMKLTQTQQTPNTLKIEDFEAEFEKTLLTLADYKEELPKSRELLSQIVGNRIVVKEIKKASEYEASFSINPLNLLSNSSCQEMMVAGAGFEPTTFGL